MHVYQIIKICFLVARRILRIIPIPDNFIRFLILVLEIELAKLVNHLSYSYLIAIDIFTLEQFTNKDS